MTSRSAAPAEGLRGTAARAAALVALCALVLPVRARAQSPEPVELSWDAPPGCPHAREVRDRIRQLAGASKSSGTPLRAEATVSRNDDGRLHLKLVVHAGNLVGERNIDGKSCADLAGATAINLALLLNASEPLSESALAGSEQPGSASSAGAAAASSFGDARKQDAAGTSSQPAPAPKPEPQAQAPHAQAPADDAATTRRWRALIELPFASLGIGPLPRPSFGLSLGGGVSLERWRFLAETNAWLSQQLRPSDHPGLGAKVGRIVASLRACRAVVPGRFELAPCLHVSVDHIWARGTGANVASRTAATTWVAVGAGAQARLYLAQWFSLVGEVDAQIETARPRISIDGVGYVGQLAPAAVTLRLGSEWIL
jgi:hypothetical protein